MGNYATAYFWPVPSTSEDPSMHGHSREMIALYEAVVLEIKMRSLMLELARYFREHSLYQDADDPSPLLPVNLLSLRGTTNASRAFRARFAGKLEAATAQTTCAESVKPSQAPQLLPKAIPAA